MNSFRGFSRDKNLKSGTWDSSFLFSCPSVCWTCSAMYCYWVALSSNELLHFGCSCSYQDVKDSWDLVNYCLTTTIHCLFSPHRNTLRQSANSRSLCSRTIMWHTPPWYIGNSSRAGAGTSVWTRKEKSWRGTMSRRTSQQPTSSPNL